MLGCRFSFEAYAKNVSEKATKCSINTTDWVLMDMRLCKFDIYQGTIALNCFKSYTHSWCPNLFQKFFLSDVRSEIDLVRRKIVSNGQLDRA